MKILAKIQRQNGSLFLDVLNTTTSLVPHISMLTLVRGENIFMHHLNASRYKIVMFL